MENQDSLKQFIEQMQKVKDEELKKQESLRRGSDSQIDDETIKQVLSLVRPIVEAFVKSDRLIQIQKNPSERFHGYHLVYAKIKNLVLRINDSSSSIEILAVMHDTVNSEDLTVYSGTFDPESIKQSIQETLLKWYRMLKSSHVIWRRNN